MERRWIPLLALASAACGTGSAPVMAPAPIAFTASAPSPDPRIGLKPGLLDAGQAAWNLRLLSTTPSPDPFFGVTNSDLAFTGKYAIQGNYNGFQVWDISNPSRPVLVTAYLCPASQSDVSVYRHLLFVSGEGLGGRLDCGAQGVRERASPDRLRGIRIFDITDISKPKYLANVQTCRGSHTHTVVEDPKDQENVYVYVSGSAGVRPEEELPGCSGADPEKDPGTALFRIEVIKVPVAHPERAAIVSSPRIFQDLAAPPQHGPSRGDLEANAEVLARAKARGDFTADIMGEVMVIPPEFTGPLLDSVVRARGGAGAPTSADSAALRAAIPGIVARMIGDEGGARTRGPTQCHDITVYPAIGLAGGACEGYGLLLDIRDPANPVRIGAVADSNFSYWHSATFNNAGTQVLFTDEWGGGGAPKCRASDPKEWGANALFAIRDGKMVFQSYYKLPVPQTSLENCVAHNGSLVPIPGRDVMAQSWYQGGVSVFDWTDAARPVEIAFFDRGPSDAERMGNGGTWSVYWYNGVLVSSEMARGLDILELTPSAFLTPNELDAARTVRLEYKNAQGQPKYVWPPSFALARAYADQLERTRGLTPDRLAAARQALAGAEAASGSTRRDQLNTLAKGLDRDLKGSADPGRVALLAGAVRGLIQ